MSFASPSTSTPLPHPVLTLLLALEGGWLRKTTLLGILRLLDNWHPIEIARPWCWEILKAGGERDGKGWDSWMALLTHGHEFEQAPGVSDRQGSLVCYSPWGGKELDTTERLNWTNMVEQYDWKESGCVIYFLNKVIGTLPKSTGIFRGREDGVGTVN